MFHPCCLITADGAMKSVHKLCAIVSVLLVFVGAPSASGMLVFPSPQDLRPLAPQAPELECWRTLREEIRTTGNLHNNVGFLRSRWTIASNSLSRQNLIGYQIVNLSYAQGHKWDTKCTYQEEMRILDSFSPLRFSFRFAIRYPIRFCLRRELDAIGHRDLNYFFFFYCCIPSRLCRIFRSDRWQKKRFHPTPLHLLKIQLSRRHHMIPPGLQWFSRINSFFVSPTHRSVPSRSTSSARPTIRANTPCAKK